MAMSSLAANFTIPSLQDIIDSSNDPTKLLSTLSPIGIALLVGALAYRALSSKDKSNVRQLGGIPVFTAWTFFTKRYDFLWKNFRSIPDPIFKFKVLQHNVVAVRGEEARKVFFDAKGLNFNEGYKILMGAAPLLKEINVESSLSEDDTSWFNKQILTLLNRPRLSDMLPSLMADIDRRAQLWGKEGKMDPFKNIYDLVFQMTVRMATCRELAEDLDAIKELQQLYWTLEKSSTPQALLLPWFPSRSKRNKEKATKALFVKLYGIVEMRRNASVPSSDAIDVMISHGHSTESIVGFVLAVVFAGVINTGITACWNIVYIGMHPEWREKVKAEVDSLLSKYMVDPSEPLHKRLAAIPVSAWDDEMPVFDSVIRESMRLAFTGAALRRNLSEPLDIAGGKVEVGDFVTYSLADIHLNPEVYTSPETFDPSRFGPGREEDKKGVFNFLGWGAGRHPCTGMKIAKLEMKVIVAYMLAGYEYKIVDKDGLPLNALPVPNRNDIHQARPAGDPCFVDFKRTVS
ncbi:hypothetical protein CVT24_002629 [Panaeolus cyanescens]|uniref:Cytochrome P450 n=1 Tax=Panaeolus cyanescens TaxID=181874 RepID=A0A409YU11_9AGAR|nr:hypothetical protein CVT24_002629 [Panaeolus cyanescens]